MAEVHPYREHNHDNQDYHQQYFLMPKQPKIINNKLDMKTKQLVSVFTCS